MSSTIHFCLICNRILSNHSDRELVNCAKKVNEVRI